MKARRKHPGGRPPKPPQDRRSEVVRVRLRPAEVDVLYRRALRAGKDLAAYIRDAVLSGPDGLRGPETVDPDHSAVP